MKYTYRTDSGKKQPRIKICNGLTLSTWAIENSTKFRIKDWASLQRTFSAGSFTFQFPCICTQQHANQAWRVTFMSVQAKLQQIWQQWVWWYIVSVTIYQTITFIMNGNDYLPFSPLTSSINTEICILTFFCISGRKNKAWLWCWPVLKKHRWRTGQQTHTQDFCFKEDIQKQKHCNLWLLTIGKQLKKRSKKKQV
jgi:hypothetical protein